MSSYIEKYFKLYIPFMSVTSNYVCNTDNTTVEHTFPSSRAVCTSPPLLHEAVTNEPKWRLPEKE
jgi:hypothetical protein